MAHPTPIGIPLALALLSALGQVTAAPAADSGFCVEDRDDALWIDCAREHAGVTGRVFVLCRRAPLEELTDPRAPRPVLIEVTDIARELRPGSGDCPTAGARRAGGLAPGTDGIPRTDGEGAGASDRVTVGAGMPTGGASAGGTPALPETTHGR